MPDIQAGARPCGDAPANPTRRALLIGFSVVLLEASLGGTPNYAAAAITAPLNDLVPEPAFIALSRQLTEHRDLNPATAARMLPALSLAAVPNADNIAALMALASSQGPASASAQSLLRAAEDAGLKDLALAIVRAWYTGTVGTGDHAIVLAYQEALMYRPVRDALTVPTYCNFGPLWWTGVPPDAARLPADDLPLESSAS